MFYIISEMHKSYLYISSQLLCGAASAESGHPESFPWKFDPLHFLPVGHQVKVKVVMKENI